MTDNQRIENAAAAREATEAAGHPHARGSRAADIEGGLMRYLAAEAYHEKAAEDAEEKTPGKAKSGTSR
ncbi:hypothetical protein [Nocardioides pocheonensis]|uniref:Uncharacterized protein n=1 Tax=Nocardioides pocheonensis TaxID=661485 RepID=A0A3N0GF66_9ACTN|nr:hypothetical protein [Nocardioides pocheonensis]RNM11114.1 hypothetical protein EFL26_23500 [Nocardioides pocheonensis]